MISGPVLAGFALSIVVACGAASCARRSARVTAPPAPMASARIGSEETGSASWYGIPYHGRRTASGEVYDMEKLTAAHRNLPFQTWVEVTNLENGKRVDVRITDRGPFVGGRIIDLSHRAARDIEMLGPGVVKVRLKVIEAPNDLPPPNEVPQDRPSDAIARASEPSHVITPALANGEVQGSESSQTTTPSQVANVAQSGTPAPAPSLPAIEQQLPGRAGNGFAVQAGAFAERERAESLRSKLVELYMDARVVIGTNNLWRVIVGRQLTGEQAAALARRVRKDTGASLIVPEPE